jgi:hypothetical protein
VVVPVYCNETTLVELRDRVSAALRSIEDLDFEIIFVDDASTDGSWSVIEAMALADPKVIGLRLAKNVGQLRADCAGNEVAGGDAIIAMDADLEHPPEAIPRLVRTFRDGHDLVVARRTGRSPDSVRAVGSLAFSLLARALRLPVSDVGSSYMIGTPHIAAEMRRMIERSGRQMMLPTVFNSAHNPTVIDVESPTRTTSAYSLPHAVRLAGQFLAGEVAPVIARRALPASGCILLFGAHPRLRRRALSLAGLTAGLALVGLLIPHTFRRDRTEPLYEVDARVGCGLGSHPAPRADPGSPP